MQPLENSTAQQRLLDLADLQIDGTASAAETAELEAMLTNDSNMQRTYLRYTLVHGQVGMTIPAMPNVQNTFPPAASVAAVPTTTLTASRSPSRPAAIAITVAASVLVIVGLRWVRGPLESPQPMVAITPELEAHTVAYSYDHRKQLLGTVGTIGQSRDATGPVTLTVHRGATQFRTTSGANLRVHGPAIFGINSAASGVLYKGSVHAKSNDPNSSFSITTANLRILDTGTEFEVDVIDDQQIAVRVLDGHVDVQSRIRLPLFYWDFESQEQDFESQEPAQAEDSIAQETRLTFGSKATPTAGIVGDGAVHFDNSENAYVRINEGLGGSVGTGAMACSSGITIEAMFISQWNGKLKDYDEIFRKEDGDYRFLLSFQNDDNVGDYALPSVANGPCLSFGLHLEKLGYSELDLPLDGVDGRPSVAELTDGKPHHVVATYDSFSGKKRIFVDGRLRFEHQFPVGILAISGGPATASLGNNDWTNSEAFHGTLDEVALYDFALTTDEISTHYQRVVDGKSYFPFDSNRPSIERWQSITPVTAGTRRVLDSVTGLPTEKSDPARSSIDD